MAGFTPNCTDARNILSHGAADLDRRWLAPGVKRQSLAQLGKACVHFAGDGTGKGACRRV